jgi:hypothetical protein
MRGSCYGRNLILKLDNIFGCRAFRTVNNLELYPSALLEGFEAFGLNCGVVNRGSHLEPLYLIMPVYENINRLVALAFTQKNRTPSFWGLCG